jgi:trans-aconitate methyltransferase
MQTEANNHWNPTRYEEQTRFVQEGGVPVLTQLAAKAGERVLDLGCGPGALTRRIADAGALVVGVDASPEMIAEARRAHPELEFNVGRGEALAYEREFDALFSNAALHWMTRPREVASAMFRALKPGGRLVAEFGGYGNVAEVRRAVDVALAELDVATVARPWCPWYFPRLGEYAGVLEHIGFVVHSGSWFPRPSPMPDSEGQSGIVSWLEIFASSLLDAVPSEKRATFKALVEREARAKLFREGIWLIDYVRLRVGAARPGT